MKSKQHNTTRWLMWVLSVCSITPFTNDVYIASLPEIGTFFQTQNVQLVMSIGLFGFAISQLIYGPISDRFGRKPVLLSGLLLFTLASAGVALSQTFEGLLIGRFFQAVGACSTIVSALAIARDLFQGVELVNTVATVMTITAISPCIAPIVGSSLQYTFGWRASFIYLSLMGLFYLLIVSFLFTESLSEKRMDALSLKRLIGNYTTLLKHQHFLGYTLTSCLSYSVLFSVITVSPMLLIDTLGLSLLGFSLIMGSNALVLILFSRYLPLLNARFGLANILLAGTFLILAGGTLLATLSAFFAPSCLVVLPALWTMYAGIGLIRPSASAGAMSIFPPSVAGSAAAMFTFFGFIGGAIFTAYAGIAMNHGLMTFALFIVGIGLAAVTTASVCQKRVSQTYQL